MILRVHEASLELTWGNLDEHRFFARGHEAMVSHGGVAVDEDGIALVCVEKVEVLCGSQFEKVWGKDIGDEVDLAFARGFLFARVKIFDHL